MIISKAIAAVPYYQEFAIYESEARAGICGWLPFVLSTTVRDTAQGVWMAASSYSMLSLVCGAVSLVDASPRS